MKIKKLSYLISSISIIVMLLCLQACSFMGSQELNQKETDQLIKNARSALLQIPDQKISPECKNYIRITEPEVEIKYSGHKTGSYKISWDVDNSQIFQVIGEGDLTSFEKSFKKVNFISLNVSYE